MTKVTFTLVEEGTTTKLRWALMEKSGIWKAYRKVGWRWTRELNLDSDSTSRMAARVAEFLNAR